MSTYYAGWATSLTAEQGFSAPEKLVLIMLADQANQDGQYTSGLDQLAKECCLPDKSVGSLPHLRAVLTDLRDRGWIVWGPGHCNGTGEYVEDLIQINIPPEPGLYI